MGATRGDIMATESTTTPVVAEATPQPRDPQSGQFRSMAEAVSALESLMGPEEGQPGEDAEAQGDDPQLEAEEQLGEDEPQEEGSEDEGSEDSEDEDSESDEIEEEAQPASGRKFTVRIDGKDERVDESELIAGYSRQSDYTRKTQALANERKQFEQELGQARQERTEYAQLLPRLRQALATGMGQEPNWVKIQQEDAANGTTRFPYEWARWQQHLHQVRQVQAEEQRVTQRQAAEAETQKNSQLAAEREALHRALPGWKDPKVARRESRAIAQVLKAAGYADDDITISDHRALVVARKAALYDQIQASKPALRQKMRQAPVVRPGGGTPVPRTAKDSAAKRLNQSGSVKDAASLLEHMI